MNVLSELPLDTRVEYLFWIGCMGGYDKRIQSIIKATAMILDKASISYAILGQEEMCTGDPARRAGNEFLFQTMAYQNIALFKKYDVRKIIVNCPHCFNTFKNEYPELNGHYEVIHHSVLIQELLDKGTIRCKDNLPFKGQKISYHDPCYLGRANSIYEAPREVLERLDIELVETKRCKKNGLCCGAGGAQFFKEEEKGSFSIHEERVKELRATGASHIATACPFCMTMLNESNKKYSDSVEILDIAELVAKSIQ